MSDPIKAKRAVPRKRRERAAPASTSDGARGTLDSWSDEAGREPDQQRYVLKLYVTGASRMSRQAIERVRAVCELRVHDRYELEVVDIYQMPALARDEQIVATPTLIKVLPAPLRRFIGNLANIEKILFGLDLREKPR
jgi:circadian clock protein KaiB